MENFLLYFHAGFEVVEELAAEYSVYLVLIFMAILLLFVVMQAHLIKVPAYMYEGIDLRKLPYKESVTTQVKWIQANHPNKITSSRANTILNGWKSSDGYKYWEGYQDQSS